jgi:uncharacterized protein
MIQPVEMRQTRPVTLHDNAASTTTDVWRMLVAAKDGDLDQIKALVADCPALATCQFNYTPPLHLAAREGHADVVRYLIEREAVDPTYSTYPFKDTLVTMADDRGHGEIVAMLRAALADPVLARVKGESGDIDYGQDAWQRRFQKAVNHNQFRETKALLQERPDLALDEIASWGEGILMMPSNRRNRPMLELLLQHNARVPDMSKWGRAYYFKHTDIAAFLLSSGMNPNHMTWHHVTLLHDMAQEGDIAKATLLLDHGSDLDPIEEEYQSTPLGLASRWGRREMVSFLLDRGADPSKSGAPWSTPLAWARKKGHVEIESDLRRRGAR